MPCVIPDYLLFQSPILYILVKLDHYFIHALLTIIPSSLRPLSANPETQSDLQPARGSKGRSRHMVRRDCPVLESMLKYHSGLQSLCSWNQDYCSNSPTRNTYLLKTRFTKRFSKQPTQNIFDHQAQQKSIQTVIRFDMNLIKRQPI